MTTINNEVIQHIKLAIQAAKLVGIESVIVEQNNIRALKEDHQVGILQPNNVRLPFTAVGITRFSEFVDRLNIVEGLPDFQIEGKLQETTEYLMGITLRAKGVKVDYRFASVDTIRAAKIYPTDKQFTATLNEDAVSMLHKAQNTIKTDLITLIRDERGVVFELIDTVTREVFSCVMTPTVQHLVPNPKPLVFKFYLKTVLAIFKANPTNQFTIGHNGMLILNVDGFDMHVMQVL